MKIVLPSNGLLGTKWVDMREPNYGDLRSTITATEDEYLFKYEFVKRLCEFDPKTISMNDVEYLYDIAASTTTFNIISFKVECPGCKKILRDKFIIGEDDLPIVTLNKNYKKCRKKIDDKEYVFHILSAQDGVDIHTYSFSETDEEKRIEEATVCKVLGYDITDENIEMVRTQIPIAIYVSCFIFLNVNKHGLMLVKDVVCTDCGEKFQTTFSIDSYWVRQDLPTIIEQYAMISNNIDFKTYLDFSIPEFKHFVEFLNAQAKKNERQ